jgi:hypothetical protein
MVFIKKSVAKLELAGEEEPGWLKKSESSKDKEETEKSQDKEDIDEKEGE